MQTRIFLLMNGSKQIINCINYIFRILIAYIAKYWGRQPEKNERDASKGCRPTYIWGRLGAGQAPRKDGIYPIFCSTINSFCKR